jgi:hypothetical protein
MEDKYHKGYRVKVRSFRSGARWLTEVVIWALKDATASELLLPSPPVAWSAATEAAADEYGLEMARDWIARSQESVDIQTETRFAIRHELACLLASVCPWC